MFQTGRFQLHVKLAARATAAGGSAQRAAWAHGVCARCSRFYHKAVPRCQRGGCIYLLEPMVETRLKQEGTGLVRFVSVPLLSKTHRFGVVRFGKQLFLVRRGSACVF